MSGTQ